MYKPKLTPELMRRLYLLKKATGVPITKLAQTAVREYLKKHKDQYEHTD